MIMVPIFYFGIIYLISSLILPCGGYRTSHIYHYMRTKMVSMDRELTTDAWMKVEAVQHLRLKYSKYKVYHIGELVYLVRKKSAQMLRLYFRVIKNFDWKNFHDLFRDLIRIKRLGTDIQHSTVALYNFDLDDQYHQKHGLDPFRRSGDFRQSLEATEAELRLMVDRRNEAMALAYSNSSTQVPDVFQKLKDVTHNWTEIVINETAAAAAAMGADFSMYDPDLILP